MSFDLGVVETTTPVVDTTTTVETTTTTVVQETVACENGCFTVVDGVTIIGSCCDDRHTIQVGSEWVNVSPSTRHGEVTTRDCRGCHDESVHCLVIRPDPHTGRDIAGLEYCNLTILPMSEQTHELYSVCISKNVRQVLILDLLDEMSWEKVLYFDDRSSWTEPQVMALVLLMHAVLRDNGLTGVVESKEVKEAENWAESYCRHMGVERSELNTLHSCGSPTRVSRVDVERVHRQEDGGSNHYASRSIDYPLVRKNSQTPHHNYNKEVIIFESGGVDGTVVVLEPAVDDAIHDKPKKSKKPRKSRKSKMSETELLGRESGSAIDEAIMEDAVHDMMHSSMPKKSKKSKKSERSTKSEKSKKAKKPKKAKKVDVLAEVVDEVVTEIVVEAVEDAIIEAVVEAAVEDVIIEERRIADAHAQNRIRRYIQEPTVCET